MNSPTRQLLVQTARQYSSRTAGPTRREKLGAAAIMGYCCIAFSTPFAGAAVVSRKAQKDQRYQNISGVRSAFATAFLGRDWKTTLVPFDPHRLRALPKRG
ncbi:hypothetical protein D0862_09167 [Hortaea werneckii]|uniref:Uncharacterized protein n=1 Tax=Hortaea werneckii TaxID=91943 RepID=A0A3M7FY41_HORWE|nr:hypothetical protein D0862_09167 [Hortaea werneckii]